MAEKDKKISFVQRTKNPKLHIAREPDGSLVISYGQKDIYNRKNIYNRADLDQEIQKLFGYESWEEYKKQNREDLYRKKGPPAEDGKLQVPTLFPFHVAYALEEFKDTFNAQDYEVVGVPAENLPFLTIAPDTSWWQTAAALTPKNLWQELSDLVGDPIGDIERELPSILRLSTDAEDDAAATQRMAIKSDQQKQRDKRRAELEEELAARVLDIRGDDLDIDTDTIKKINLVLQMRKAFFGSAEGGSILKIAMYQPLEALSNKDVISRVEDEFKKKFDIQGKFEGNFPVNHPGISGRYWNKKLVPSFMAYLVRSLNSAIGEPEPSIYSTATATDAYVIDNVRTKEALNQTAMLNENKLLLESAVLLRALDNALASGRRIGLGPGMENWVKQIKSVDDLRKQAAYVARDLQPGTQKTNLEDFAKGGAISEQGIKKLSVEIFNLRNAIALRRAQGAVSGVLTTGEIKIFKRPLFNRIKELLPGNKAAAQWARNLDTPEDLRKVSKELGPYDLRQLGSGRRLDDYSVKGRSFEGKANELEDWANGVAEAYARRAAELAKTAPKPGVSGADAFGKTVDDILEADTVTIRSVVDEKTAKSLEDALSANEDLLKRIEALEGAAPSNEEFRAVMDKFDEVLRRAPDPNVNQENLAILRKIADDTAAGKRAAEKTADLAAQAAKDAEKWSWKAKLFVATAVTLTGIWILCRDGKSCQILMDAADKGDWPKFFATALAAAKKAIDDIKRYASDEPGGEPGAPDEVPGDEAYEQAALMASSQVGVNLKYYILPKGWRNLNYLTKSEKVLSDRIGAKTNILKSIAKEKMKTSGDDASAIVLPDMKARQGPITEVNALFFGHSQGPRLSEKLATDIRSAGGESILKKYTTNDAGLANEIKEVKGNFTHAYLFLNGNEPGDDLHENAKKDIIDYVQTSLGVPKENILVVLPPVNNAVYDEASLREKGLTDKQIERHLSYAGKADYSRRRGEELNPRARKYFEGLGVKVAKEITSTNPKDFPDGYHYNRNAPGAIQFRKEQLSNLTPKTQVPSAVAPASRDEQQISSGEEVNILQHLAEGKVTIINFTNSTWCDACIALKPILEESASNPNVALRKIHIDDWDDPVLAQYGVDGIPYWAVFDPAGKLVASSDVSNKDKLVDLIVSDNLYDFRKVQSAVDKALGSIRKVERGSSKVSDIIKEEAQAAAVDPKIALAIGYMESNFGKSSENIFQFSEDWKNEWKKYGLDWEDVNNPRKNVKAAMGLIKAKIEFLRGRGIIENSSVSNVDPAEAYLVYLSYQQGNDGFVKLFQAAKENLKATPQQRKAIDDNVGDDGKGISPREFFQYWRGRLDKSLAVAGRLNLDRRSSEVAPEPQAEPQNVEEDMMGRLNAQYGGLYSKQELAKFVEEAEAGGESPGKYIRDKISQSLKSADEAISVAGKDILERFDSSGGVVVLDPRKSYAIPSIIPWLKGLSRVSDGKWVIGDISLPLGGGNTEYPKGTILSPDRRDVRFAHKTHRLGRDVDVNLPLKGGKTNKWNEDITNPNLLDEEKLLDLLKHFYDSPAKRYSLLNTIHVDHMRRYTLNKYGKDSQEHKLTASPNLRGFSSHLDHIHFVFKNAADAGSLSSARQKLKKTLTAAGGSALAAGAAASADVDASRRREAIPRRKKIPGKPNISYILGDLEPGGQIYAERNENRLVASGASMNKPILALVQLLKYRDEPEKQLNKKELDGLLAYTGVESNKINRLVSGRLDTPKARRKYILSKKDEERIKTIGTISKDDAKTFLNQLGLDPNMKIRFGDFGENEQTAKQFFDFMRLIHDESKLESLGIGEEASTIVNYMKRNVPGTGFKDREAKRWAPLVEELNSAGIPINRMYGKGGLIKEGLHYSFVINDKYLLSMYSDQGSRAKYKGYRKRFYDEMKKVLKDSNIFQSSVTESKVLNQILNLIQETQNNELV